MRIPTTKGRGHDRVDRPPRTVEDILGTRPEERNTAVGIGHGEFDRRSDAITTAIVRLLRRPAILKWVLIPIGVVWLIIMFPVTVGFFGLADSVAASLGYPPISATSAGGIAGIVILIGGMAIGTFAASVIIIRVLDRGSGS
jgi:hypothetical protein